MSFVYIALDVLKPLILLYSFVIFGKLVSLIKEKIGTEKLDAIVKWTKYAVLKAQQVMQAETGAEKKAYVTEFLKKILIAENISISDEQLDVLIEAAVKEMKMEENAGILIEEVEEQYD